ncbi:unnamed protein product [Brachionus calyciflorus]|uniref:Uncharacterized protein n=1 Tax=Brachionus calyciflorus TaxID=104777 RepID=A0A814CHG6_9BILA|nr:unnamed protein product [Brachionus calyciflorus]
MYKVKIDHELRLRKFDYKIGDLVLTDHPKLKRGLSQGIARKYYGPFEKVGKNLNDVDYFIKKVGSKRGKITQIHKSRLKIYYYSKPELNIKLENSDDENEDQIGLYNRQEIFNKKINLGSKETKNNNLKPTELEPKFDKKLYSSESSNLSDDIIQKK